MSWGAYILGLVSGMAILDIARRVGMLVWAILVAKMVKPLWRVLRGRPRFYDMLWCTYGSVAFLILMYGVRAIYAPNSADVYLGLHVLSAVVAVSSLIVIHAYMRAHKALGHG